MCGDDDVVVVYDFKWKKHFIDFHWVLLVITYSYWETNYVNSFSTSWWMKDVTELTCRYDNNYHNYCDDENNYDDTCGCWRW